MHLQGPTGLWELDKGREAREDSIYLFIQHMFIKCVQCVRHSSCLLGTAVNKAAKVPALTELRYSHVVPGHGFHSEALCPVAVCSLILVTEHSWAHLSLHTLLGPLPRIPPPPPRLSSAWQTHICSLGLSCI